MTMELVNHSCEPRDFHSHLVGIAGIRAASSLLDVGCGTGQTIMAAAPMADRIVGVDNNKNALDTARQVASDLTGDCSIELLEIDLNSQHLPFQEAVFDCVICQNVLECIEDKQQLIDHCHRVLKPGGIFLLAHHDFGGVMLSGSDAVLTREIVAAYADEEQGWMAAADAEIGRKLPGIMQSSKFSAMKTETRQLVGLSYDNSSYAYNYCADASKAAIRSGANETKIRNWLGELAELDRWMAFYFSIPWVYVRAVK
ncbi:methyltransferase domain-containing protein [Hoeflea sp. TYP-13]|uniref:methyltransferase domain-containing protein n=1 Tax=Hoeflea sp. TYP-13 TaxID=3230023 RepID=UPI0034C6AF3A